MSIKWGTTCYELTTNWSRYSHQHPIIWFYDQIPENVSGMHSEPATFITIGGGFQLPFAGGGCDWELGEVWRGCPPDDPNHNTIISADTRKV